MLGIIACRALEDELAHVLSEDHDLRYLILIDNLDCFDLSRKLRSNNRSHLLISLEEIPDMLNGIRRARSGIIEHLLNKSRLLHGLLGITNGSSEEIIVVINVLKIALHIDNKILRAEESRNIRIMSQFSDGILLFYGRCGNALQDIEVALGQHYPLFFLIDDSGEGVGDCIAVALGGNKHYAEALNSHQGVGYFCTPMGASTLNHADNEAKKYAIEHHLKPRSFGDVLVELGYSKIAKIDTGLSFISDFEVESAVNRFADLYNLEVVILYGNAKIAECCYEPAKKDLIDFVWDDQKSF